MALPLPFRRRGKIATATTAAKRVALARAAYALWQTRLARKLPGRKPKPFVTPARAAIAGGVLAGIAGLVRSRRGGGGGGGGGVTPAPTPPPAPSNYDAPGPPANTATPVAAAPVGDPGTNGAGIDEEAEVAAAAAQAGAIGGTVSDYAPSIVDEELDEAERPLAEAGEGVSEGQEQAEGDLADLATTDIGPGAGQTGEEALIEDTIAQQSNPASGEIQDLPSAPPGDK